MERASSLLAPLIRRLGLEDGVRLARIKNDWNSIFDKPLSLHMSPSRISEGELLLYVDSPVWIQQLGYYKKDLLRKLGAYGVRNVRFMLGRVSQKKQPIAPAEKPAGISPEDESFMNAVISEVCDEDLREAVRGALEKSLKASARPGKSV